MSNEDNPFFLMGAMLGEKAGEVTDLRRRIEELEAKLRKSALQELSALGQASEAYQAQLAAEAKLAKQDDLVQAAVAAALREAVEIYRKLSEGSPVGAADGQTYHVRYVTNDEFARNILDLIPEDAQAALDRYVKERSDELVAEQRERIKGLVIIDEAGTVTPEMWDVAAAIRKGGE